MKYNENYNQLQEDTLITMADGSSKAISTICIGDSVMGERGEIRIVTDLLRERTEVERINSRKQMEKSEVTIYTLILEGR